MTEPRVRLDRRMVEEGLSATRSRAQALIMAGQVLVNGRVETKSGRLLGAGDSIDVAQALPFVSRGGFKLAHALTEFAIDPVGWRVIDVGASTGGFTDCWLQRGASKVYAVDVGYGQLDWRLRQDHRVVVMERTNARYLLPSQFRGDVPVDGASIDAAFIGLKLLLDPLRTLVAAQGSVVALVKPQFEAGPERLGKGGVVRDPGVHREVLHSVISAAKVLGYSIRGLTASPIRGPQGNIEFLLHLGLDAAPSVNIDISAVVLAAWKAGRADA